MPLEIAVIGSGNIGAALARAWSAAGHSVTFGARDAASVPTIPGVGVASVADAITGAAVVTLAVPFRAVPDVAAAVTPETWRGKIVVDCTNAIGPGPSLVYGHTDSSAEVNARLMPGSRLVKSFTAQGAEVIVEPRVGGIAATNFYCGDDAEAKAVVRGLIADVGLEPLDVGGLSAARALEPLTLVWFAASRALGSRHIAFKMLRDADHRDKHNVARKCRPRPISS